MKKILLVLFVSLVFAGANLEFSHGKSLRAAENLWSEPKPVTTGITVNTVQFLPDGKLLFAGKDGVFLINTDGTGFRTLFTYQGIRRANLRADGKIMVLDNDFDIFVANADGSGIKPVAADPKIFEFAISFTPDGKNITYVTIDDANGISGIWKMAPDGANKRNLLLRNDALFRHPRQSPDGTRISYFTVGRGRLPTIWVMDKDGRNSIPLTKPEVDGPSRQASWSADGNQLAFSSRRDGDFDIWIMDKNGGNKTRITNLLGDEGKPVWSPRGDSIAFICSDCRGKVGSDLYIVSRK